jgi:hypothetical protein
MIYKASLSGAFATLYKAQVYVIFDIGGCLTVIPHL